MQQDQSKKYTYFISGGGTGGHIYPAVSIVQELLKEEDTEKIFYVGNPKNLEYEIIEKYPEVEFLPVSVKGMPRNFTFKFIKWLWNLEISTWKALYYILKYKPDVIFTTGGYVSAPVAFAAIILKKNFMIHDCDIQPGLVSKLVAPFAKYVSVAFEKSKKRLKSENIVVNGNPVRSSFNEYSKEEARKILGLEDKLTVMAMGGSQGANTINNSVIEIAKYLVEDLNLQLIIQTGRKNYADILDRISQIWPENEDNKSLVIRPYFDNMAIPLNASDIVISRAGSLSLSEINSCALASILIPYPYAAADHQRKNAIEMIENGAALYIEDDVCSPNKILSAIKSLIDNPNKLKSMSESSRLLARPDASKNIINQLKSVAK